MDARSQHTYPRDRPLIHNPNHQSAPPPPPAQQPPFASFASGVSQTPGVHVPFGDPYVRRNDPFMPSSHQRRGSYGLHGATGGATTQTDRPTLGGAWSTSGSQHSIQHGRHSSQSSLPPPPPPQIATSLPPAPSSSYSSDQPRRSSLGNGSPPGFYQTNRDSLPPPPSVGSRQMLPPSPQQSHHTQRPFSSSRELPGLGAPHRPGSGMSISSILGGETSSSTPLQNSPPIPPSAASPTSKSMQPPSPRRAPSAGARTEYGLYRRPHTPDRYSMGPASRPVDPPAYSTTSPSKNAANAGIPSDQSRHGLPPSAASPWNSVTQDSRLYSSANGPREKGMSSSSSMPQRPNSQPTGPATTSTEPDRKPLGESMGYRRQPYTYSPEERRRITSDHDQNRSTASEGTSRPPLQSNADLNRAVTVQPVSHSAFSPPRTGSTINSLNGVNQQPQPQSLFWRPQVHDDNRRQSAPPNRDEAPGLGRSTYGAQTAGGPPGTRTADGSPLPPRTIDYNTARPAGIYNAAPTSVPASVDRRREQLIGGAAQPGRASPYDQHPQRSFLLDATRRTGRASPLPQAVQGASSQPIGPAGNPNIKSEFGRMFSGLGGGISSVPSRNGTQTPSRQSPLPRGPGESFGSAGGDHADLEMARTGSQSGRKSKRTKDEDGLIDSDSLDGRATPTLGGARGAKRSKPNHAPGHHHHHHMHPHHHHHHHHKADEDAAATAATTTAAAAAASQTNSARLNPALAQSSASAQSLHHHHHHHASHPPHHHHHPPRPSTVPPPPQVIPKVIVNIQSVLDSVSENPRNHLGSQLYEAQPVAPPSTVPLEDRFGINTFPKPLPSFGRDRANCTFTIRVPRYYLRERQREMLCKRPYIWGSRIYRDDSDPLAAAVHSGWILGAWNKGEVDVKMLDPRIKGAAEPTDPEEPVTEIPAAPIEPPSNYDLQLTLLILPPLEKYHSTAEYGVRSRKAGGGYSGMSFMISSLRWVNEGIGSRGQERGAQAQSKRLSAAAALMALAMDRPADQGMSRKAAVGA